MLNFEKSWSKLVNKYIIIYLDFNHIKKIKTHRDENLITVCERKKNIDSDTFYLILIKKSRFQELKAFLSTTLLIIGLQN